MRIETRGDNVLVPEHTRQVIEKKVRLALGRVTGEIAEVRVMLRDANGPRSGVDQSCTVDVRLRRGGEIRAEATEEGLQDAIDRALGRASRSAHRLIARQQEIRRDSIRFVVPDATY